MARRVLGRAHRTLIAGCDFVAKRQSQIGAARDLSCARRRGVHDRLLANHLRELDRFLCVLLEEIALRLGGPDHDARHFAQLRKTSDKLHLVERMIGMSGGHGARLSAIRRIAMRLRRPEERGRPGETGASAHARDISLACGVAPGTPLTLQPIARFYRDLGDDLMADISARPQILDFPTNNAHLGRAIVACDGI